MVLVFEPVVWEDGHCGHRSEEIVAITEDGYLWLSNRAELDGAGYEPRELDTACTEMEQRGIDALVLGREANARAVSGADRLWLSGTRRFAPGCVVVRKTAAVHLLANSNDGFEEFPTDHLYPVTWNPAKLLDALRAIPGLDRREHRRRRRHVARRCDALFATSVLPGAELADAGPIFAEVWRVPSPDKVVRPCTRPRASCAAGSRRWRRFSATACARASPRRVRGALRSAGRHDAGVRGGRRADRRRRVHVAATRASIRRGRKRRAPGRRAAQRVGGVARAGPTWSPSRRSSSRRPTAGPT